MRVRALKTAWRLAFSALAPAGGRGRLSILIFHRVLPEPDVMRPDEPDADRFAWQMDVMGSVFQVLPLREAVERLRAGTLPARAACITFDDGYADNHDVALPILAHKGLPATFFVATHFLDGGWMFNDVVLEAVRRVPCGTVDCHRAGLAFEQVNSGASRLDLAARIIARIKYLEPGDRATLVGALVSNWGVDLPESPMMNWQQVRALSAAGMELGAHTARHPILARVDAAVARTEIIEGKKALEEATNRPVTLFAYPNGVPGRDYSKEHVEMVQNLGFDAAVCTHGGVASRETPIFELPRFTPWDREEHRFLVRMALNLRRVYDSPMSY